MDTNRFLIGERILLALWVGGLWTVGYLVAPVLFASLDDRSLAGTLAGKLFQIMSYIGLVCGSLLLMGNIFRFHRLNWRAVVLVIMLVLVLFNELILSALIADMRHSGAVDSGVFAQVHGAASVIFLIISLLGLSLVAAGEKASR